MKKFAFTLALLPIILSCVLYTTSPLGETNFPLKKSKTIPIRESIEGIAVGDTWIAVQAHDSMIGLDIDTFETLWTIEAQVNKFGEGFEIVNDRLVTTSGDQIIIVDKQGNKEEKDLDNDVKNVVRFLGIYSDYVYVAGGSYWNLEAYDLTQDRMLWKSRVGGSFDKVYGGVHSLSDGIIFSTKNELVAYKPE